MEKILDIVESIAHEKGLDTQKVEEALRGAFVEAAKKSIGKNLDFEAISNKETKSIDLYQKLEVVADDDERLGTDEDEKLITISEAKEAGEKVDIGEEVLAEVNLQEYGRTASMALHFEIEKAIQKLVEDVVYDKYKKKVGQIVSGTVVRVDQKGNTYLEIGEIKAAMPRKNRIKGESFSVGDVVKAIVRKVNITRKDGIQIELSRTTPKFLEELLRLEVPEIDDGSVIIKNTSRIPGERAKVALYSVKEDVDPVGATVGVKGIRINAVSKELKNESIDVINYSPVAEIFISRAMAPAIVNNVVTIGDHQVKVTIASDQKAKAIGKSGINIRLASMLTGYEIELEEVEASLPKVDRDGKIEVKEGEHLLSSLFKD